MTTGGLRALLRAPGSTRARPSRRKVHGKRLRRASSRRCPLRARERCGDRRRYPVQAERQQQHERRCRPAVLLSTRSPNHRSRPFRLWRGSIRRREAAGAIVGRTPTSLTDDCWTLMKRSAPIVRARGLRVLRGDGIAESPTHRRSAFVLSGIRHRETPSSATADAERHLADEQGRRECRPESARRRSPAAAFSDTSLPSSLLASSPA